jgi:hypothetical protein
MLFEIGHSSILMHHVLSLGAVADNFVFEYFDSPRPGGYFIPHCKCLR